MYRSYKGQQERACIVVARYTRPNQTQFWSARYYWAKLFNMHLWGSIF